MTYSLIKPKLKPILSGFAKIWLCFYILCLGLLTALYFVVATKTLLTNNDTENKRKELAIMQDRILKNDKDFEILTHRKNLGLEIIGAEGNNTKAMQVVMNLFDFVLKSGSIRLESMNMNKNSLDIRGVTPTKEMFLLLVQTPLKSTFDTNSVNFYPLSNGWYKFVSINKIVEGMYER